MKITRKHLRRLIREERERILKEMSGSDDEVAFRRAVDDFVMDHMNTMGMNAGNPTDRKRIRNRVQELVDVQLNALGLGE